MTSGCLSLVGLVEALMRIERGGGPVLGAWRATVMTAGTQPEVAARQEWLIGQLPMGAKMVPAFTKGVTVAAATVTAMPEGIGFSGNAPRRDHVIDVDFQLAIEMENPIRPHLERLDDGLPVVMIHAPQVTHTYCLYNLLGTVARIPLMDGVGMSLLLVEQGECCLDQLDGPELFRTACTVHAQLATHATQQPCDGLVLPAFTVTNNEELPWLRGLEAADPHGNGHRITAGAQTSSIKLVPDGQPSATTKPSEKAARVHSTFFLALLVPVDGKEQVAAVFRIDPVNWVRWTEPKRKPVDSWSPVRGDLSENVEELSTLAKQLKYAPYVEGERNFNPGTPVCAGRPETMD